MEQCLRKPDHVKVKLSYTTTKPNTEPALALSRLGFPGPYLEEIRILVPVATATSDLETYRAPFASLLQAKVLPDEAVLKSYAFEDEDTAILAYVVA